MKGLLETLVTFRRSTYWKALYLFLSAFSLSIEIWVGVEFHQIKKKYLGVPGFVLSSTTVFTQSLMSFLKFQ
jgi:hypothetical protein